MKLFRERGQYFRSGNCETAFGGHNRARLGIARNCGRKRISTSITYNIHAMFSTVLYEIFKNLVVSQYLYVLVKFLRVTEYRFLENF